MTATDLLASVTRLDLLLAALAALAVWWALRATRRAQMLRSALHSAHIRRGTIAESLAPLLDTFPVDVTRRDTTTVFLGQPVDFVHFDPDSGIVFVEVKSGASQLSAKQRRLRELVAEGKVFWETYRVE